MDITPTEMATDLFEELGELSDQFLDKYREQIPDYVDTLVGQLPAQTADVDTWWWLTAIGIALDELLKEFRQNLGKRYVSYSDYGLEKAVPYAPTRGLVEANLTAAAAGMNIKTRESILNGLRGDDLEGAIKSAVEKEIKEFIESLDTVFSIHDRIAMREAGDELVGAGLEIYWVYAGPADKRNRPFCGDIVRRNSMFTLRGIDKLNAHPDLHKYVPPNVFTMCGGHGCRHLWMPVQAGSPVAKGRDIED